MRKQFRNDPIKQMFQIPSEIATAVQDHAWEYLGGFTLTHENYSETPTV